MTAVPAVMPVARHIARRTRASAQTNGPMMDEVAFGPFRLVGTERLLLRDGRPVEVGGRALDILIALVDRAGEVVTRRDLMERVWPGVIVDETNVRV